MLRCFLGVVSTLVLVFGLGVVGCQAPLDASMVAQARVLPACGAKLTQFASYLFEAGSLKDESDQEAMVSNWNHLWIYCFLFFACSKF